EDSQVSQLAKPQTSQTIRVSVSKSVSCCVSKSLIVLHLFPARGQAATSTTRINTEDSQVSQLAKPQTSQTIRVSVSKSV
ncbi:hypothetical protein QUA56_05665, partial [Microcoleus sp. N3A4]|uniref:hypothetical protein n=1 Tax=Microcoleus sp. N3A4 TaxID=3055379 RepID=UPI002FCED89A